MKKRGFFNLCMVAALSVATTGSLYSCQDYDDEIRDLQEQILSQGSSLKDLANTQKEELGKLQSELDEIKKKLEGEGMDLNETLKEYLKKAEADEKYLTKEEAEKQYATISELTGKIALVNARIDAIENCCGKVEELRQLIAKNASSIDKNTNDIKKNQESIKNILKQLGEVQSATSAIKAELDALDIKVSTLENSVEGLEETLNSVLSPKVVAMSDSLANVYGLANANAEKIAAMQKVIDDLQATDGNLQVIKRMDQLEADFKALSKDVASKDELDKLYSKLQKESSASFDAFDKEVDAKFAAYATSASVDSKLADLKKELQDAFAAADDAVKQEDFNKLQSEVAALKNDVAKNTEDIVALNAELNTVKERLDNLEDQIAKHQITNITLNGAYSPVIGYFAAPVGFKSNVLAAYYGSTDEHDVPAFPTTATSCLVDANAASMTAQELQLLGIVEDEENVAWYQGATLMDESADNAGTLYMGVNPSSVDLSGTTFSLENSEGEESGIKLSKAVKSDHRLSFGYSRAGSKNGFYEVSAKLDANKIADSRLRFDLHKIKDKVKEALSKEDGVDMTKLISTLYTEFNDIADANAVKASWTVGDKSYEAYSDYGLAAIAVKPLSYNTMYGYKIDNFWGMDKAYKLLDKTVAKFKEVSKKVTDEFPQFDINQPRIDTITLQELTPELLGKFVMTLDTTVTVEIDTVLTITVPAKDVQLDDLGAVVPGQTIKNVPVKIPEQRFTQVIDGEDVEIVVPENTVYIDVPVDEQKVTVDGPLVTIEEFAIKHPFTMSHGIKFHYVVDMREAVEELYDSMGEAIGDANEMVKEIKRFFDEDIQSLLDQINGYGGKVEDIVNGQIDKVKGELSGYLDKINKKLCNLVEGVNAKLQPVMFLKTADSFVMMSSAKNYPSVCPSRFVLSPSSYTAELLAPAFKKFVAVTDVIDNAGNSAKGGNANCISVLKSSNKGDLNKVIEGKQLGIQVDGFKKGYTYEFTYSALDYYGYIVNTKYYVYVK